MAARGSWLDRLRRGWFRRKRPAAVAPLAPRKTGRLAYDNFLLAHYERATRRVAVTSRPSLLLLDPSSLCQLQCPMCPTGLENAGRVGHGRQFYRRPRGLLRREVFESVLADLGEVLFFVHLYNWGEPLLNRDLTFFIRELARRDIVVVTNTNLSLPLDDQAVDALVDSGIARIEASIDGFSQATYGRYRVKGRFELARDNLVRLAAARDRLGLDVSLVWNFLVFRFNEAEIEPARRFCEDHGIAFVRREAAVSEALREEFLPGYREGERLEGFFEQRGQPFCPDSILEGAERSCAWHYFYSIVNADGSVSPCCAPWESDWDLGVVAPGGTRFADIWNGRDLRRSRSDVSGKRLLADLARRQVLDRIVTVDDFVRQGTICQGCQMPAAMLDLYSNWLEGVVTHRPKTLSGRNAAYDQAFSLLAGDRAAFVRHYETFFLHDSGQAGDAAAGR